MKIKYCVGNIVLLNKRDNNNTNGVYGKIMGVDCSYRMDGSLRTKFKVYANEKVYDNVSLDEIEGISLTDEVLLKIGSIRDKNGRYVVESFFDTCINLERDWRDIPSYHIGIEYTDSPFEEDFEQTYNFSHEVKYVHELQNILNTIYGTDTDLYDDMPNYLFFDNLFN